MATDCRESTGFIPLISFEIQLQEHAAATGSEVSHHFTRIHHRCRVQQSLGTDSDPATGLELMQTLNPLAVDDSSIRTPQITDVPAVVEFPEQTVLAAAPKIGNDDVIVAVAPHQQLFGRKERINVTPRTFRFSDNETFGQDRFQRVVRIVSGHRRAHQDRETFRDQI